VAKLKETLTGDTLGDKSSPIRYAAVQLPEPAITFAIEPKSRADEDKLGVGSAQADGRRCDAAIFSRPAD